MSHLKTIVVGTDLSTPSRHAADRGGRLARTHGGVLTLVHTLGSTASDDLRRWLADSAVAQAAVGADARDRLHALALDLGQTCGSFWSPVMRSGPSHSTQSRWARTWS